MANSLRAAHRSDQSGNLGDDRASPGCNDAERTHAVESAKAASPAWRDVSVAEHARYLLNYQALLKAHQDSIATVLSEETGKTFADAKGDVWRGIEVVEHAVACSTT